jgi:hypothetical protein
MSRAVLDLADHLPGRRSARAGPSVAAAGPVP